MKENNNKQLMKLYCGTWQKKSCMDNPLIQATSLRESFIINEPAAQRKKENKNTPLNLQNEIITIFLVIIPFLLAERNKGMMTTFKESLER